MREPIEIEVDDLFGIGINEPADAEQIIIAIKRAQTEQRTSWLMLGGVRIAAIVPLEVGRVMDPDELPKPGAGHPTMRVVTSPPGS